MSNPQRLILLPVDTAPTLPNGVKVEFLSTPADIREMEAPWRDLQHRVQDSYTYFQTYDWCLGWVESQFGATGGNTVDQVYIATVHVHGRLAAIFPMLLHRVFWGVKVLKCLGEPLIQYSNILLDERLLTIDMARTSWTHIRKRIPKDGMAFGQIAQDTSLSRILDQHNRVPCDSGMSSILDLSAFEDANAFRLSFSKSSRKNRNKRRNKLKALGDVTFVVEPGGSAAYSKLVGKSLDLKKDWLAATGRSIGAICEPATRHLLQELPGESSTPDGAIAMALMLDGKPIAIEIGFCQQGHYYAFLGAYDPDYSDYSPGKLQMEDAVVWAIENGLHYYDFLGNPSDYKEGWTNKTVPLEAYRSARTPMGYAYSHLWKPRIKPAIKELAYQIPVPIRRRIMGTAAALSTR